MDYVSRQLVTSMAVFVAVLFVCLTTSLVRGFDRMSDAPATLRIRPPPMISDAVSPDCYNFTYGNWRKQEFYSPNYPGLYLNNTDCVLYLEAPSGFRIQLDFRDQFTLEKSENCKYDFLEVRDGPFAYSPLIGRFCGHKFPPLIESTNRFLWLRFKTDDLLHYEGFKAIYSYHKDHTQNDDTALAKVAPTVCRIPIKLGPNYPDGELTSQEVPFGDVSDPSYPKQRPVDCTWEIYTDQGNAINLRTIAMKRATAAQCDNSFVEMYKGTTLDRDRAATLCDDRNQGLMSVTSDRNRVFVRIYGNSLYEKPDLRMVYTLVKTDVMKGSCANGYLSCGDFCISHNLRCNGLQNCPDGRDEVNCPKGKTHPGSGRRPQIGPDDEVFTDLEPPKGHVTVPSKPGDESQHDDRKGGGTEAKIPLLTIVLGVIGGVLLTAVIFGLCVMCRFRRREASKKKEEQRQKESSQRYAAGLAAAPSGTPTTQPLVRTNAGEAGREEVRAGTKGQGQAPGRYRTFANVAPTPKDNTNRYSLTGSNPQMLDVDPSEQTTDPAQFRRYITLEMTPDDLDESSPCPTIYSQGNVIGMTHIPSPTTSLPHSPVEGGYVPSVKYTPAGGGQWSRVVLEDPTLVYPYTSSLTRPTPFLGLSKPFQQTTESKYLKSMQALKSMDEEIMRENPAT